MARNRKIYKPIFYVINTALKYSVLL